jgi:hypothetical protein
MKEIGEYELVEKVLKVKIRLSWVTIDIIII